MRCRSSRFLCSLWALAVSLMLFTHCGLGAQESKPKRSTENEEAGTGDSKTKPLVPSVRGAVTPKVSRSTVDLQSNVKKVKPWKEGDPVRVVQDLRTSGEESPSTGSNRPSVRDPQAPKVVDRNLANDPPVSPPDPETPVRVIDDLKIDGGDAPPKKVGDGEKSGSNASERPDREGTPKK